MEFLWRVFLLFFLIGLAVYFYENSNIVYGLIDKASVGDVGFYLEKIGLASPDPNSTATLRVYQNQIIYPASF